MVVLSFVEACNFVDPCFLCVKIVVYFCAIKTIKTIIMGQFLPGTDPKAGYMISLPLACLENRHRPRPNTLSSGSVESLGSNW